MIDKTKTIEDFSGPMLIDWKSETDDPIAENDAIFHEYSKSFNKVPGEEMFLTMRKVKAMLVNFWSWHRDEIREALVIYKQIKSGDKILVDKVTKVEDKKSCIMCHGTGWHNVIHAYPPGMIPPDTKVRCTQCVAPEKLYNNVDWELVGKLIDTNSLSRSYGNSTGTSNWGANLAKVATKHFKEKYNM